MFQRFFQRHGESMFATSLPDVKNKVVMFIAIYNQWDISAPYLIERLKKVGIFVS